MDKILVKQNRNIFTYVPYYFFLFPLLFSNSPDFEQRCIPKLKGFNAAFFLPHSKEERARCKKLKYLFSILYDHSTSSIKSFSHGSLSLRTISSRSTVCKVVMSWMKYEFTRQIIFQSKSLCSYYLANIN